MMRLIFFILILGLGSCMSNTPYEIKSPCVSGESNNPYAINPCIRRPANIMHDII